MTKLKTKKVLSGILGVALAFALVACKKEPTDLKGNWKSDDPDAPIQEAVITENSIEINWVGEDDLSALYWAGTYEAPTEAVEEYSWVSQNDHQKTDTSILASEDDTKEFTYKDGVISYKVSAMGVSATVKLKKTE